MRVLLGSCIYLLFLCLQIQSLSNFDIPCSAEEFLNWKVQTLPLYEDETSITVNVINTSPWYLDFPKALHVSGNALSMPFSLKPKEKDIFVSTGAFETEGLLSFPISGLSEHICLYWKVSCKNNKENMIGIYFGSDSLGIALLNKIKAGSSGFSLKTAKETWHSYNLNQQFTAQVMITENQSALAYLKISYGYQVLSSGRYKIEPYYALGRRVQWTGTALIQTSQNLEGAQMYRVNQVEDNFYTLSPESVTCNLAIVNQFSFGCITPNTSDINQKWELIRINPIDWQIRGAGSTLLWDNNYMNYDTLGGKIILWEEYATTTQVFRLISFPST